MATNGNTSCSNAGASSAAGAARKRERWEDESTISDQTSSLSRADVLDIVATFSNTTQETICTMRSSFLDALKVAVEDLETRSARRVAVLQAEVDCLRTQQNSIADAQAAMREDIDALRRALALAESSAGQAAAIEAASAAVAAGNEIFDRMPDPTMLRISTRDLVELKEMQILVNGLLKDCDIPEGHVKLEGKDLDRRFRLRIVEGMVPLRIKRASKLIECLRSADGSWRQLRIRKATGGDLTNVYLSRDKSQRQVRIEMEMRRLRAAVESRHPGLSGHYDRVKGIFSIGWVPIAKLDPIADAPTRVLWVNEAVQQHKIEKDEINRLFHESNTRRSMDSYTFDL